MGLLEPTADTGLFTTAVGVILLAIDTDVDGKTDSLADGKIGCATRLSHWCDDYRPRDEEGNLIVVENFNYILIFIKLRHLVKYEIYRPNNLI